MARQSIFGDELSTYWISATHGFGGVISLLYGSASIHHAEITPPLYFVLAWMTSHLGHSVFLLRLPSLVAGVLSLPVVYLLGCRTVGRRGALVATALTTFSPFMIYYSTEARAYAVMMLLVMVSTLAMLIAVESGRARWWVVYAVCSCAAVYSHLTCGFVLAGQFLWLLWAHPEARGRAVVANLGAVAGLLPWTVGFLRDFSSPTLKILSALSPFSAHDIPIILGHWAIGYPYANSDAGVAHLPGPVALILLAAASLVTLAGLIMRSRRRSRPALAGRTLPRTLVLVVILALVTPLGEALVSSFSSHIFGVRNLAASWPELALCAAALLTAPAPRFRAAAVGLALGGFAIGAALMLNPAYSRPNYQAAADLIDARSAIHAVIDETGEISPGPLTPLDLELRRPVALVRAGSPQEHAHPFGFADPIMALANAVAGAVGAAHGGPVAVVSTLMPPGAGIASRRQPAKPRFPAPYRLVETHVYDGLDPTEVSVYADPARVQR
ncbi:MAG: glycosyltransferase family 39 protein [Solirubrobacteraceae bacterium]